MPPCAPQLGTDVCGVTLADKKRFVAANPVRYIWLGEALCEGATQRDHNAKLGAKSLFESLKYDRPEQKGKKIVIYQSLISTHASLPSISGLSHDNVFFPTDWIW